MPPVAADGLLRLSVDVYGGPILATFADRDLSLAGRIAYKNDRDEIASMLVKFDQPLLRLPNLAIHMNRAVNDEGLKLQKQNELPLILSAVTEEQLPQAYFSALLQQQAGIAAARILSWDLAVYDTQKGVFWGAENEFYADSQLDNLASCHAALQALLDDAVMQSDSTLVCAFFDHEEIGSQSNKGADGSFLPDVLERIALATGTGSEDYARALAKSFMVSADMAHAYQPNFPNAYDPGHKVGVNKGPVIKINANHQLQLRKRLGGDVRRLVRAGRGAVPEIFAPLRYALRQHYRADYLRKTGHTFNRRRQPDVGDAQHQGKRRGAGS